MDALILAILIAGSVIAFGLYLIGRSLNDIAGSLAAIRRDANFRNRLASESSLTSEDAR